MTKKQRRKMKSVEKKNRKMDRLPEGRKVEGPEREKENYMNVLSTKNLVYG